MSDVVISVENIFKEYQLGVIGTGTFRGDMQRWWAKRRGLPDPHIKIGEKDHGNRDGERVWALKDVSFQVRQGESVGIIGRNGAGKSTLLKILSRVTAPTSGVIKAQGKIASLLEVGTGFHPELTGRENIFLNGAILGMSRAEVNRKMDEIVDFSGVETYIDTPVKRYSSGMYVRLAFAVAAHLEPDILVVDEVLAVGDAEFQKKCLGKMDDVSRQEGRTILFVSHNMLAIKNLCKTGIYLEGGMVEHYGSVEDVVQHYLQVSSSSSSSSNKRIWEHPVEAPGNEMVRLHHVSVMPVNKTDSRITVSTPLQVKIGFWNYLEDTELNISVLLLSVDGGAVFNTWSLPRVFNSGLVWGSFVIPGGFLNNGVFTIHVVLVKGGTTPLLKQGNVVTFEVNDLERDGNWYGNVAGVVRPQFDWVIGMG